MSEPRTALNGAGFNGFARIAEAEPRGMIALRGDLSVTAFGKAVTKVTGLGMPGPRAIVTQDARAVAWMSPDELLVLCGYDEVAQLAADLRAALAGRHNLIANVSDARALFSVTGTDAREVIAKLTPADVSSGAFGPGEFRRSRLAQVPAAFWMPDETVVNVICFRSVARYVFDLLQVSAAPGSEVDYF